MYFVEYQYNIVNELNRLFVPSTCPRDLLIQFLRIDLYAFNIFSTCIVQYICVLYPYISVHYSTLCTLCGCNVISGLRTSAFVKCF